MKKICLTLLSLWLAPLAFAAPVGKIVFFEGSVTIVRDEKSISADDIDFGAPIENYDMITTGPKSSLEITLDSKTGVSGSIKLSPNSSFYLELSALQKEQTGGIELLKGTVAVKVDKLLGKTNLQVRTDSAVMGVRGTRFKVTGTNGGDFLVTTEEGRVECTNDKGEALYSEPGSAVEVIPDERFRTIPVSVSTIESFEANWFTERSTAFQANAPRAIKNFAIKYDSMAAKLRRAYEKLQQEGMATIATWKDQAKKGIMSDKIVLMKEKKALIGNLLNIRKVLFIFERVYYRLTELREYAATMDPKLEIGRGYTLKAFFEKMKKDESTFVYWMNQFRYLMKLYSERNEGSFPTDGFGSDLSDDDFSSGSDFFN